MIRLSIKIYFLHLVNTKHFNFGIKEYSTKFIIRNFGFVFLLQSILWKILMNHLSIFSIIEQKHKFTKIKLIYLKLDLKIQMLLHFNLLLFKYFTIKTVIKCNSTIQISNIRFTQIHYTTPQKKHTIEIRNARQKVTVHRIVTFFFRVTRPATQATLNSAEGWSQSEIYKICSLLINCLAASS